MIGLDANVPVRYLAQDDPIRSATAVRLVEHRLSKDGPGFISLVALVEADRVSGPPRLPACLTSSTGLATRALLT
jgi:predicted nucleic-acid-binding protein